jgi:hypothetical protein
MAEAPIVNAWSTKSTVPIFRIGDYAPVFGELTTFDLPVEGAIPPSSTAGTCVTAPTRDTDTTRHIG